MIELHWSLTDVKSIKIDIKELLNNSILKAIGDVQYRTLNEKDLIAYLCIHGVFHAFFRLQWLLDIYQLVKDKTKKEQLELYYYFESEGISHFYLISLQMLHCVFNLSIDDKLHSKVVSSNKMQTLVNICLQEISENDSYSYGELESGGLKNTFHKHRMQYLTGGLVSLLQSVNSRNVRPQNWQTFVFPDRLFFLNNLFSRVIWFIGKLKKRKNRQS